ncbi:MAG: N-6 DNA methylase [Acidobacteriia bacterium]|nr:N-6 DNA methylase [Terriglobia bacterium]
MSLKKFLAETASGALSEIGFYTPLATHVFGALLGYPPTARIINKSGKHGVPDIRLKSQEPDGSEWAVVEAKIDDQEIRDNAKRASIWHDQILEHGYIGPETFYVVLCAPRTFYVCDLGGQLLETLHIESDHLTDPKTGDKFPLSDKAFRDRMQIISYAASLERPQLQAFREGKLKSGHIPITVQTLDQLQGVFSLAIEKLREYCRLHFRRLAEQYEEAKSRLADIDRRLDIIGSGAVQVRKELLYRRSKIRSKYRLALQVFEEDYREFKHDQTYAGTQKEEHFEDIFCTNTAYVALSRLIFVRICEDVGLTTRKISNSGIAVWREFVQNIKGNYQDLLDVAFKDVAHVYSSLFESSVFDWFGKGDGQLHDILERILFRLNAFSFREMNRDVLGSIYQYFRPRVERRRLGEYYTPVEVVDYILARTGILTDAGIMQKRILDPACGSFTFGVRATLPLLKAGAHLSPENKIELVRNCLRGQDINPFSVFLSHLSLLFGLLDVYLKAKETNSSFVIKPMDVGLQNSLTLPLPSAREIGEHEPEPEGEATQKLRTYDYVVGNPPFVRNERLPQQDREVLNEQFPSLAVRNTDLSVYFLYAATKYFTKEDGVIGMVAPIGIANSQWAAYLRNTLMDYQILELVSLEWCAKQVFPGADIVPMLIFVRNRKRQENHKIRLVRGLMNLEEIVKCTRDESFRAQKTSELPFETWAQLSDLGDWCLEVAEQDVPILEKLNSRKSFEQADTAHVTFAVKAGNNQKFLRPTDASGPKRGEVPFVKGQHVAAFAVSHDTDEFATLSKIGTAEDTSIWGDLEFYEANAGLADTTGMGRHDYRTSEKLATGSPSDTLCCLIPEIYVTFAAAVVDPLQIAANNSTIAVVPKKGSAFCLAAIINSRASRYYSFLTRRAAILLRKRTTWFPRAVKALPMPSLTPRTAKALHDLAVEATDLSGSVKENETEAYIEATTGIAKFTKAGFLGLRVTGQEKSVDREELAAAEIVGQSMTAGAVNFSAPSSEVLTLARVALLAADKDEFEAEDIENIPLPADAAARAEIASRVRRFAEDLKSTQERVLQILEEIDEIVADGLGLTPAEHETMRKRCREFPLSVTVERPRLAWSADRKRQARRTYLPGERFKT